MAPAGHGGWVWKTLNMGISAQEPSPPAQSQRPAPARFLLNGNGHILHTTATPKWSTVSAQVDLATIAGAVSIALTLADKATIQSLIGISGIRQITLINHDGDLSTLT